MKILLVGEYSGVFTGLKTGLSQLGIDSFTVSDGDGYKGYNPDYLIKVPPYKQNNSLKKRIDYIAFRLGINGIITFLKEWKELKGILRGYDIVQLINPIPFSSFGSIPNFILVRYLFKHNKMIFLSVLGDDYYTVKWLGKNNTKTSFFKDRFFINLIKSQSLFKYKYCLFYKKLNDYIVSNSKKIIPGLYWYKCSYEWSNKVSNVIPFPINENMIGQQIVLSKTKTINIFHGWQKGKESRKGNDVFDRVIKKVVKKYGNRVSYKIVQNIPYDEYVQLFNECHIFIDQLYADDKGMNGLIGMAAGKVVFSGFEEEALAGYKYYTGKTIGIKSSNDEECLFQQFCNLIDNPSLIETISKNAIEFTKDNHLSKYVAQLYMDEWLKN